MEFYMALKEIIENRRKATREAWSGAKVDSYLLSIRAQFPDENSMMTEPYLVMEKRGSVFPIDLSCESIFADDWILV